ncbi:condensation domain-containing protein (plasmid) [Glutamicibacter sp. FR1]|uniref:condensation domain-containing protein n=1 Tax=Glutamicibacter sp. FR1 TaxID=3393744 RepID=UPI0039AEBA3F
MMLIPHAEQQPVSSAQFRLWFLNQMDPDSAAYNMGGSFDWPGTVDGQVLQSAVDHIVQRHESLRTTFSMSGGDPVQVISPSSEISVGIAEWAPDLDRSKREWLESQYRSVADHPFDLERGPLLRVALLSVGPAEHVLVVVMHHIISDGWSMQVFLRELFESYHALANQKQPSLPELPIQYADYALWQRERLTSPAMQNEVNYWRTVLADAPAQLSFPDADPTANDYSGETIHFRIDAETVEALKVLAKAENATLFMVLSAAFKWALYEVTGQTDLLVGTPVSGRDRPEVEHLIGFFVNTVILRTNLEGIQSFRELVRRERDVILDAFSHQSLPFDELVRTLNPGRRGEVPFISCMLIMQSGEMSKVHEGLGNSLLSNQNHTAKLPLSLAILEQGNSLVCSLEYSNARVTRRFGQRLLDAWRNVVSTIELETDAAFHIVRSAGGDPNAGAGSNLSSIPKDRSLLHVNFEACVDSNPTALSIMFDGQELSYATVDERANQLAHWLKEQGIEREDVVAGLLTRPFHRSILFLATMKVGAVYAALDSGSDPSTLNSLAMEYGVKIAIVDGDIAAFSSVIESHIALHEMVLTLEKSQEKSTERPAVSVHPLQLAYIVRTSGTAGRAKVVGVPHQSICHVLLAEAERRHIQASDRIALLAGGGFDVHILEMGLGWVSGAGLIAFEGETKFPTKATAEMLVATKTSVLLATPTFLSELPTPRGAHNLRLVMVGGEVLHPAVYDKWSQYSDVVIAYGPSETAGQVSSTPRHSNRTIGTPIPGVIFDLDKENSSNRGVLHIQGPAVSRGYLGRPGLTALRFRPVADGGRRYNTGDIVRRVNNEWYFEGRVDAQVKILGTRVELNEVEDRIAQLPAVKQAILVPVREGQASKDGSAESLAGFITYSDRELAEWSETRALDAWQETATAVYENVASGQTDYAGWSSEASGVMIPSSLMSRWLDEHMAQIYRLAPRRVADIGAGDGNIATRLGGVVDTYLAVDTSQAGLHRLETKLKPTLGSRLSTKVGDALDVIHLLKDEDVVILNSVVQYFPSVEYLSRLLKKLSEVLSDSAVVYLGDLRSPWLANLLHDSSEKVLVSNDELLLDPGVLGEIAEKLGRKCVVTVRASAASSGADLGGRYSAWLVFDEESLSAPHEIFFSSTAEQLLHWPEPTSCLVLRRVPLQTIRDFWRWQGDPSIFWGDLPKDLSIDVTPSDSNDCFDVHMSHISRPHTHAGSMADNLKLYRQSNAESIQDRDKQWFLQNCRLEISRQVPAGVTFSLTLVDSFPMTPNGKVDVTQLLGSGNLPRGAAEPQRIHDLESVVRELWLELIGVESLIDDEFFLSGGNSLLATRLSNLLASYSGVHPPVRMLFEHPTVDEYVAALENAHPDIVRTLREFINT